MKFHFGLLLFLFSPFLGWSQAVSIRGVVQDATDKMGIEFATITLFNQSDSTLVGGIVTEENGLFVLEKLSPGTYFLKVNFIGYDADTLRNIVLSPSLPTIDLGLINLKNTTDLETIDVVASKGVFENRIDKKIFNADQSLAAKGGTGIDLLRQVPSITVDQNDNILLRGDGSVTLLVDGRPSAMPVNELMKQIPSSAIERVEIITNPSAKYDPEGMSGIINIVLKKNKLEGFNGTVNASVGYGVFPKANGSVNLNYRKDKFNLTGNYGYNYSKVWFGGDLQRDVLLDSVWDRLRSEDYGERKTQSQNAGLGLDYFANDYNTIYVSTRYNRSITNGIREVNYQSIDELNNITDFSQRNGSIKAPNEGLTVNGGWQKTFKKPDHTLDLDLTYGNNSRSTDEQLKQEFFDESSLKYNTTYQNTAESSGAYNALSKLDYVLPILDSLIMESGVHFTLRGTENGFFSESALSDQNFSSDAQLNNTFNYDQNVIAAYVTLAKQFKKFGVKAGVRSENTKTTAHLINTNETFSNDYFKLFPSAHLSYKTSRNSEIQLSYSKRINRPEMNQLNPFTNFSDPLTLQRGNPFLRPEIIHVNELSYMKFWEKWNINASVYYRIITDLIRRNLSNNGVHSLITYENLGESTLTGGDLTLTFLPVKGLRIISATSVWNTATNDQELTGGAKRNYLGLNSSLQAFYQLKGGWSTQIWASYSPQKDVVQGIISPNYGGGLAIQKTVLKRRGRLNLSIVDILKTRQFTFDSYDLGNYNFRNTRRWESRAVYFSFTYSFGKMTQGKTRRQSNSNGISDENGVPELQ